MLNYGYEPSAPLTLLKDPRGTGHATSGKSAGAKDFLARLREAILEARAKYARAQERMAKDADKHKRAHNYKEDDKVWLSTANLRATAVGKLGAPFVGPFKILEMVGKNAAKLKLPATMKIHPVVNVSWLKPQHEAPDIPGHTPAPPPAPVVDETGVRWYVDELIGRRFRIAGRGRNATRVVDYRVKWKGYGPEWNMWVTEKNLLEDGFEEHIAAYDARYPRDAKKKGRNGRKKRS
jgi:hypothetical protein